MIGAHRTLWRTMRSSVSIRLRRRSGSNISHRSGWDRLNVLHREIQAKWPTRAVLADRFWAIRRIPSNYQRHSVWGIENGLHWVLDVTFGEDQSRLRKGHGAKNMALVRHFAFNLLRQATDKRSIKRRRKNAGWSTQYLETILGKLSR
jgi:Transposase